MFLRGFSHFTEVLNMNEHTCSLSGCEINEEDLQVFDDQDICPDCLENHTCICACCGERIWNEDDVGDSSIHLCQGCYDRYYTTCEDCGRVISCDDVYYDDDDDGPYCYRCYQRRHDTRIIHDYYYKPEPVFFGSGPRYFGVELEIDEGGELSSNAQQILEVGNKCGEEIIYIKHDGSLSEGLEIVTHPASLDYHMDHLPWPEILETARSLNYRSHQCGSCGLHVHVSRKAFGRTFQEQDDSIARVLYFVEKNWEELLKFSRRTPRQLERWAARYGYKDQPKEILEHAKKGYHAGRYTCVNLENSATVEFRMFRGTLKLNTLLATLQMVDRICDVAVNLSDDEITAMSWTTFVTGCTRPELVQYLKERRLYINEPVITEEEV